MKSYSDDLRLRIIETIQENELSQAEIAGQFSVSLPFVEKLWHRFRTTGSFQAKVYMRGPQRLLKEAEALIRALVKNQPDLTLAELCERVAVTTGKPPVTTATMCVELQRLKLPRKKSRFTPPSAKVSAFSSGE
jgi:transposase